MWYTSKICYKAIHNFNFRGFKYVDCKSKGKNQDVKVLSLNGWRKHNQSNRLGKQIFMSESHNSVLSSTYRQARTPNIIFLRNAVNDNIMYIVQTAMCINVHYIHKDVVSLNEIRQACDNLSANNISCCKPFVFFSNWPTVWYIYQIASTKCSIHTTKLCFHIIHQMTKRLDRKMSNSNNCSRPRPYSNKRTTTGK